MSDASMLRQVATETEALHAFFVDWFAGRVPNTDEVFAAGVQDRIAADFTIIPPAGTLLGRHQLVDSIRRGFGGNPDFQIAICKVALVHVGGDVVVATYEEWQRNAKASTPPNNGRAATAIFRPTRGGSGLRWQHVHETWLPEAVMAAGVDAAFDAT